MVRVSRKVVFLLTLILTLASLAQAQTAITYIYDDLGRLIAVVDPSGETVTYTYDAVGNILSISRFSSGQLSIIDFTPKEGPEGTSVTIYGTGFSSTPSENTVKFNGVTASVASASSTEIVTSVPSGAMTGTISVTTPAGSVTSSASFDVTSDSGAPTITSLTPFVGTADTAVTIDGTNFEPIPANNKVKFNLAKASIDSATVTSLATTVPSRATSGRITLTTPAGTTISTDDFFVPPDPFTAADVEFTGRMAIDGTKTVTISTANKIGLVVFDGSTGQRLSMNLTGTSIASGFVSIYNPDGTILVPATSFSTTWGFIEPQVLPVSGTYTVLVDPSSTSTGSVTLNLYDVPPDEQVWISVSSGGGGGGGSVFMGAPGQNAQVTFDGTTGSRVSWQVSNVTVPGTTAVVISNPSGSVLVPSIYVTTSGYFVDSKTLPEDGTYVVSVNPSIHYTGGATVFAYDATDVTGTITPGGPSVTPTTSSPGQDIRLTFEGTANQRVSLKIESITVPGVSSVSILKPDGTTLASTGVYSPYVWFIDTQTLPVTGTYTILVNPNAANTGSLTLSLYDVIDVTGTIAIGGPAVTVDITAAGQAATLTFDGITGQQVSLQITGVTIPSTTYVTVYKPDGTTLAPTIYASTFGAFLDTQTLPVTGSYSILINPLSYNTGSMTLTLYDASDITGTITPGDPPMPVTFTNPGQNALLTFDGTVDQKISLKVEGITLSGTTWVYILKPDGTTLASVGVSSLYTWFIDTKTLPVTGTYTISVNPYSSNTGNLTLTHYDVPQDASDTITLGGPAVNVNIPTPGQNGQLTFSGTTGQQVTVRVTNNMITGVTVKLLRPEGTTLTSYYYTGSGFTLATQTLPVTGTYTITINPSSYMTGSLDVTLTNP